MTGTKTPLKLASFDAARYLDRHTNEHELAARAAETGAMVVAEDEFSAWMS